VEEEERGAPEGGGAPFKGRTRRWPRAVETVGGQGSGRGPNAVGTAAPLFGPWN
jgi:hypothetical protein